MSIEVSTEKFPYGQLSMDSIMQKNCPNLHPNMPENMSPEAIVMYVTIPTSDTKLVYLYRQQIGALLAIKWAGHDNTNRTSNLEHEIGIIIPATNK